MERQRDPHLTLLQYCPTDGVHLNHSLGIDGNEQVESFVPAETVAPADVSLARQPARTPSLGIPGGHSRTIQSFVGAILCLHHIYQMQEEGNDGLVMVAQQPIKLAPIGQGGKGSKQSMFSVAVETSLTPKAAPLAEDGEGKELSRNNLFFTTCSAILNG